MKSDYISKIFFLSLLVIFNKPNSTEIVNICKFPAFMKLRTKFTVQSAIPRGRLNAGNYSIHNDISEVNCILLCCKHKKCNFSIYVKKICYVYECDINNFTGCMPVKQKQKKFSDFIYFLLRYPETIYKNELSVSMPNISTTVSTNLTSNHVINTTTKTFTEKMSTPIITKRLKVNIGKNITIFLPKNSVSLVANVSGNPNQKYEYEWDLVSKPSDQNAGNLEGKNNRELILKNLILGEYQFKLMVKGNNSYGEALVFVFVKPEKKKDQPPIAIIKPSTQTVQLPNNVILDGSGSTDDDKIVSYHWEIIQGPIVKENIMKDDQPMLQLDKTITQGNYTFKLTVKDTSGQLNFTIANLIVLPEKDYPPKSDPGPNMILNLPVNSAILNGSGSTDDKKIVSYEWSKVSDGLTADIQGVREPILKLSNLQEGTYTFNLKVTDSADQVSNKEVKVYVKPRVNVPPVAKASTTPDGIVTVRLPATEAVLNGSLSSDDDKIVKYQWEQTSGQQKLNIVDGDKPIAFVNDLKIGSFQFRLTVWDSDKQAGSDIVTLKVNENQNQKPKATVVESSEVYYLQPDLIKIDGSKSWDDHKIVKYQWIREDDSLAVGDILEKSYSESVLLLTGLLPGLYKFKLIVYDEEGLYDSAITSLQVFPSKLENYFLELQFQCPLKSFTESKKNIFINNLQLIIQKHVESDSSRVKIHLLKLETVPFTNSISILFYVTLHERSSSSFPTVTKNQVTNENPLSKSVVETKMNDKTTLPKLTNMDALKVLEALNEVRHDSLVLTFPLIRVETYICQNNCSGHGKCNTITRLCECDTFWTNSLIRGRFGDGRPNCDWSIIYLVLFFIFIFLLLLGFIWIIIIIRKRKCKNKKVIKARKHKYIRLNEYDPKYKIDPSLKFPKSLTNGIKSRLAPDKEISNCDDSDSNLSSEGEETVFINNRNSAASSSLLSPPSANGQTQKNL